MSNSLRTNQPRLVITTVEGQIAHPVAGASAYRVGADGRPRVLPGTGGISINQRIGDLCVGVLGDHVEPGVALHNNGREVTGPRNGPNNALLTYACVGNPATVISGPCAGKKGTVTGKHGGVNHVLVDFDSDVLERLRIGDRVQIRACGAGLALTDLHSVSILNCDPGLLAPWGLRFDGGAVVSPITHVIPFSLMGSGLGKNTAWRGDYDIQLHDQQLVEHYRLGSLRYGDFVAILGASTHFGPSVKTSHVTLGIVVHSDSTVSGHGPGVTPLLSGPRNLFRLIRDERANLAAVLGIREPAAPLQRKPLRASGNPAQCGSRSLPRLANRGASVLRLERRAT